MSELLLLEHEGKLPYRSAAQKGVTLGIKIGFWADRSKSIVVGILAGAVKASLPAGQNTATMLTIPCNTVIVIRCDPLPWLFPPGLISGLLPEPPYPPATSGSRYFQARRGV